MDIIKKLDKKRAELNNQVKKTVDSSGSTSRKRTASPASQSQKSSRPRRKIKFSGSYSFIPKPIIQAGLKPIHGLIGLGVIATLIVSSVFVYRSLTTVVATAGGELREGVVGQPQYINPVLSLSGDVNRVDRNIESLVYPRLFKLTENGELNPQLVEEYSDLNNGREYQITLKQGLTWNDGEEITIDDVLYTIQTIQNPEFKSPLLNAFRGVTVERLSDYSLKFTLSSSYSPFLSGLTFGILPEHVWSGYDAQAFALASENLEPVGAGPFEYQSFQKNQTGNISSYTLVANNDYWGEQPKISQITYVFYADEEQMAQDFERGRLNAMSQVKSDVSNLSNSEDVTVSELKTPQYFGIFFNTKAPIFEEAGIRKAIARAVNRDQIVTEVLDGRATPVKGALTPYNNFYTEQDVSFDFDEAQRLLDEANWKDVDSDGIREKDNRRAEFTLLVADGNRVQEVTTLLQSQLQAVGIQMNVQIISFGELNSNQLPNRAYEALFIGETLNVYPDPYVYWHSSQSTAPGFNFSQYSNVNNDGFLESARTNTDPGVINSSLAQFQEQIANDAPAVFLYTPHFLYYTRSPISNVTMNIGNDASDRYTTISSWYANTKRVFE